MSRPLQCGGRAAWRQYRPAHVRRPDGRFQQGGGTGRARFRRSAIAPSVRARNTLICTRARRKTPLHPCRGSRPEYGTDDANAPQAHRAACGPCGSARSPRHPCGQRGRLRGQTVRLDSPARSGATASTTCQRGFLPHGGSMRGSDAGPNHASGGPCPDHGQAPWTRRSELLHHDDQCAFKRKDHLERWSMPASSNTASLPPQTRVSRREPQRMQLAAPSSRTSRRILCAASSNGDTDSARAKPGLRGGI